jgi:hypothetical protein
VSVLGPIGYNKTEDGFGGRVRYDFLDFYGMDTDSGDEGSVDSVGP